MSDDATTLDAIQRINAGAGLGFGAAAVLTPRLLNAVYGMRDSTPETVLMTRLFGSAVAAFGALALNAPPGEERRRLLMIAAAMNATNALGALALPGLSTRTRLCTALTVGAFAGITAYGLTLDEA